MKKILLSIVGIGLLVAVGLLSNDTSGDEPIRIGANLSLTGFGVEWGENSRRGAELAVHEINAAGGILGRPLELVSEDNQTEPRTSVTAAVKLISVDRTDFMLTGWAHVTEPVIPIIDEAHVVAVTVSAGNRDIAAKSEYLFRTWPQDHYSVRAIVGHMQKQGYTRVGVLRTIGDWEDSLRESFIEEAQAAGISVTFDTGVASGSFDERTIAAQVRAADLDALFIPIAETDTVRVVKQLRGLGFSAPLYFPVDFSVKTILGGLSVSESEGVLFPLIEVPGNTFIEAYTGKFNEAPGVSSDTAYDAVYAIAKAIENAGTADPEVVKDHFVSFDGASGRVEFTEDGDRAEVPIRMMRIQGGKSVEVH